MLDFLGNDQPKSGPMPRKPRFFLPGVPVHVVQRGNNRQPIFFDDLDYRAYLDWLKEASERWSCRIHASVLMTNHVHLLMTSDEADGVSRTMQYLGRRYVPYINHTYRRSGTLWEGRFKSSLEEHPGLSANRHTARKRPVSRTHRGDAGNMRREDAAGTAEKVGRHTARNTRREPPATA